MALAGIVRRGEAINLNAFHEKAGECQRGFVVLLLEFFAFEPSRLCRHPSIRTLCERFVARCQVDVLVSAGAAT